MNLTTGDVVYVKRDIFRAAGQGPGRFSASGEWKATQAKDLYAKRGTVGRVVEVFRAETSSGSPTARGVWSAKIRTGDGVVLTFRLTSLALDVDVAEGTK